MKYLMLIKHSESYRKQAIPQGFNGRHWRICGRGVQKWRP